MTDPRFTAWPDADAMADALSARIISSLRAALETAPEAGLVVSGGSTPKVLYRRLAVTDLPWDRIVITLADEREVPPDHPASNERLLRETLLAGKAGAARFIGLSGDPAGIEQRLSGFPWPSCFTLLGMGNDGHTASLFPGGDTLSLALDPAGKRRSLRLMPGKLPPDAPFARITLTLPALIDSKSVLILIEGAGKKTSYEEAAVQGLVGEMPVRALLGQDRCPVEVHWAPKRG